MTRYTGEERRSELPWHLDKKFAISIIFSILLNSGSFIWYGAKLDAQVQATKQDVSDLKVWRDKADSQREKLETTLSAVNQKLTDQGELLRHVDELLERRLLK